MSKYPSAAVFLLYLGLAFDARSEPADKVAELLRRQTQELMDAVATGSVAVWERYLHEGVRYIDESGTVSTKKMMIENIKPLPEGVSGKIAVTEFDAVVHGNVAVATHVEDESEVYHGHALHCQYRTTDTWIETPQGWRLIAAQILALRTDPPSIPIAPSSLDEYCGRYVLAPSIAYEIRRRGDGLEGQQTGRKAEELRAEAPDVLFVPGRPRYRYVFLRGPNSKITGLAQRREAWDLVWKRSD